MLGGSTTDPLGERFSGIDGTWENHMFNELKKNIQDKTGKKKPGEGDRLLVGVFAGNQQAGRDLYLRGHHTDFTNPNVISYANKGFALLNLCTIIVLIEQERTSEHCLSIDKPVEWIIHSSYNNKKIIMKKILFPHL